MEAKNQQKRSAIGLALVGLLKEVPQAEEKDLQPEHEIVRRNEEYYTGNTWVNMQDSELFKTTTLIMPRGIYNICRSQMFNDNATKSKKRGMAINCCKVLELFEKQNKS